MKIPDGERCGACTAPLDPGFLICLACGAVREPALSLDSQRRVLHESRQALVQALSAVGATDVEKQLQLRERFLHNAFIPTSPELLIEEALYCRQQFSDSSSAAVKARFGALLTGLHLQAADNPSLLRKLEVLRKELASHESEQQSSERSAMRWVLGILIALILAVACAIRACSA